MDYLITAVGALIVLGGMTDSDFFMQSVTVRALVNLFGRKGARVLCAVVGGAVAVMGILGSLVT